MIIIKVQGGLGNQLLQYSIGQVIATRLSKEVAYDVSFFETNTKYTKRPYLLNHFNVSVRKATKEEIQKVRYPYGVVSALYVFIFRIYNKFFLKKYYVGYDKNFLSTVAKKDNMYLEGFWQSYMYYKDILKELSGVITLKDAQKLDHFKNNINFTVRPSVAIHIRRGDYLNQNSGIQVLGKEYYKKAVDYINSVVPAPTFYVFSDDVDWVKKELGDMFKSPVYVSSYNLSDCEEFSLMKDCDHAILSNSTFSWLPAVLTYSQKKIVVYSADWKNKYLNNDSYICPEEWKKME